MAMAKIECLRCNEAFIYVPALAEHLADKHGIYDATEINANSRVVHELALRCNICVSAPRDDCPVHGKK